MKRARRAITTLVAAALLFTGCATAGEQPASSSSAPAVPLADAEVLDDPLAYEGASTAAIADAAVHAVMEHPTQSLPATVVSHDRDGDVDVVVGDTSRVITLDISGSLAATVWGLGFGETLVARDQSTTFPGTEDLPLVTSGGHTVNAESIIALEPSVVITDGSVGPRDVVEQLRDVGIQVVFVVNDPSFSGAAALAEDVAAVYGAPDAGAALAAHITGEVDDKIDEIATLPSIASGEKLRMIFLYLRGASGVYYLFGEESGADELITALGGVDVAGELGRSGMQPMTDEAMVAADPDLILVMTDGLASVGGVDGLLESKPAIAITAAGQHRRFVDMADGEILSFGPRSADVLDALARAIYAPAASDAS
ncbi:iron complex transport system substrate-binding protein [Microbacterium endophyticum]|uniref:Iron complex transport system substrate-binding protein n=1 Tax=Microbacterium endophyticum TaxID=1526412 RepID=A0A7W4V599_9MICO|nr:ABC transporter substrate-binding protein [Microbacterium endophyticum]MBB2977097.1 iron complex transport system substrate-binding protein [Microbacterium endophyticum]NIK36109.1 iron complex transport system substrate-binding protein [Microbacterium endophyticum]